jgi:outer membrane lipoprotein-sorting protein
MKKNTAYAIASLSIWFVLLGIGRPASASESKAPQKLAADFKMTRTISVLSDQISSSGKLILGGPGLLRWETVSPSRSLLVVNQAKAWIQYPDLDVTRQFDIGNDPVMKVLSEHLFALTKGNFKELDKWYKIEEKSGVTKLHPKQPELGKVFSEIAVSVGARGVVRRVEMKSTGGDVTVIEFINVRFDPPLSPNTFRVE